MHHSGEVENIYTILRLINSGNMYKILSESARFYRQCDKNILVYFSRLTVPIAIHFKNAIQSCQSFRGPRWCHAERQATSEQRQATGNGDYG